MGALWHDIQTSTSRAADAALTATMNALHPDLPPLLWYVGDRNHLFDVVSIRGQVDAGHYEAEAVVIADQWAVTLGLPQGSPTPGSVEYRGDVDGVQTTVWAVVDRDLWDQNN